ncbi:hypothetical protein [Nonomuraea rhizosphaerae]|uniref:hypothetical protein n=1 Tax=Nonomuraea rhizosphaerae TaxID=2665663 RepID=UPI001C5F0077|nr:hypothetical protein [Nonomuraea rhizosphaerae]
MTEINPQDLAARYVALWTEPDPGLRRDAIRSLWSENCTHIVQAPEEILKVAADIGFTTADLTARGYDSLEVRVSRAYEEFVAPGEYTFKPHGTAQRLEDVVKLRWEMVPVNGGEAAGVGLDILVLDADGRIKTDYQFIES